jgi:DNA-binding MarR family transcriptional regulator
MIIVTVLLDNESREQLPVKSEFFIQPGENGNGTAHLLVYSSTNEGPFIQPGDSIEGIDSSLEWNAIVFKGKVNKVLSSDEAEKVRAGLRKLRDNVEEKLNVVDWKSLSDDAQEKVHQITDDIKEISQYEESQEIIEELDRQVKKLINALKDAGSSEEAQEAKDAIEKLYQKFRQDYWGKN